MIAREAVLNDPRVVKLLRDRFVCLAIDNVENQNMTTDEKAWLANKGGRACTQGMSAFTAGGRVLMLGGWFVPDTTLRALHKALARYRAEENVRLVPPTAAERKGHILAPPAGGLVTYVTWKVLKLDHLQPSGSTAGWRFAGLFGRAVGVDRMWVRADEAKVLAQGRWPASVERRILRLMPVAFGRKPERADLRLEAGRLSGSITFKDAPPAAVLGYIAAKQGKVTRFDVVVRGPGKRSNSHGSSAGLQVIPEGESAPVGVAIQLANPSDELAKVPPHYVKDPGYFK